MTPVLSVLADLRDVPLCDLADTADDAVSRILPDVTAPPVPVAAFNSSI